MRVDLILSAFVGCLIGWFWLDKLIARVMAWREKEGHTWRRGDGGEKGERCGDPTEKDWGFWPRCGKPIKEPFSGTEVVLRGLLGYHQRLKNIEKANGEGESPMADIYEASLIDAIKAVREREQNQ